MITQKKTACPFQGDLDAAVSLIMDNEDAASRTLCTPRMQQSMELCYDRTACMMLLQSNQELALSSSLSQIYTTHSVYIYSLFK